MSRKKGVRQAQSTYHELTYSEIAEEVERVFGEGSVGLGGEADGAAAEVARATFVRACILLVVKQRCEAVGLNRREQSGEYSRINREVRLEYAALLGIDENEAFRLHHHAAGLRAKDPEYRETARAIERGLAEKHGMTV